MMEFLQHQFLLIRMPKPLPHGLMVFPFHLLRFLLHFYSHLPVLYPMAIMLQSQKLFQTLFHLEVNLLILIAHLQVDVLYLLMQMDSHQVLQVVQLLSLFVTSLVLLIHQHQIAQLLFVLLLLFQLYILLTTIKLVRVEL